MKRGVFSREIIFQNELMIKASTRESLWFLLHWGVCKHWNELLKWWNRIFFHCNCKEVNIIYWRLKIRKLSNKEFLIFCLAGQRNLGNNKSK